MRKFIKTFWLGITFWLWFVFVIGIVYFTLKARQSTDPWLWWDASTLYTNAGETLTAAKRNALVGNSFFNKVKVIQCGKSFTSSAIGGYNFYTWTASDCGGTYKPTDFTNCYSSTRAIDGASIREWSLYCRASWSIQSYSVASQWRNVGCNYLCRNQ